MTDARGVSHGRRASPAARSRAPVPVPARVGAADWGIVALLCLCALLSGVLEVLFVPSYIGTANAPFVILFAVVGNLALPRLAHGVAPTTTGAVAPVLAWLGPVLALTLIARPEGDVLVAGSGGQPAVFYGLLLGGAAAGFVSIVLTGRR
jgi:hypothetical protein